MRSPGGWRPRLEISNHRRLALDGRPWRAGHTPSKEPHGWRRSQGRMNRSSEAGRAGAGRASGTRARRPGRHPGAAPAQRLARGQHLSAHRRGPGGRDRRHAGGGGDPGPLLLALFVAVICAPLYQGMRRRGLPSAVAMFALVLILGGMLLAVRGGRARGRRAQRQSADLSAASSRRRTNWASGSAAWDRAARGDAARELQSAGPAAPRRHRREYARRLPATISSS